MRHFIISPFCRFFKWILLLIILVVTAGCNDRIDMAVQKMEAIHKEPVLPIDPPPNIVQVENFNYRANNLRSPFMPPSLVNAQNLPVSNQGVKPDPSRTKQPLEDYELSELVFRGIVVSPDGERYGLIQRPDGTIANAQVGDYIGTNEGRIVEITPTQINLIKIVPDGRVGYIEQPESLVSPAG